jgi:hypothetical protein
MSKSEALLFWHSNWRVNGLRLGCGPNDINCPRLQGTLPPALGNLSELYILDMQVFTILMTLPFHGAEKAF